MKYSSVSIALLIALVINCDFLSGSDDEVEEINTIALIRVDQETIRTHVSSVIQLKIIKVIRPPNVDTSINWKSDNEDIVAVDERGYITVKELGKAKVVAGLYDESQNLLATDTVLVYSEAKKVFETLGVARDISMNYSNKSIFITASEDFSEDSNQLLQSNDSGDTWRVIESVPSNYILPRISRSVINPDNIISNYWDATYSTPGYESTGIMQSIDGGIVWSEITHPHEINEEEDFGYIYDLTYSSNEESIIYALGSVYLNHGLNRLYISENNGFEWRIVKDFLYSSASQPSIFLDDTNPQIIYINIKPQPGVEYGGFVSEDGGGSWDTWGDKRRHNILHVNESGDIFGNDYSNGVHELVLSQDYGKTWESILSVEGFKLADFHSLGEFYAALYYSNTNAGHIIKYSINRGQDWKTFSLSFNDWGTFTKPRYIKLISVDENSIEILCTWGGIVDDNEGEIWKLKIHYSK